MRLPVLSVLAILSAGTPLQAGEGEYLSDTLKKPAYRRAMAAMLRGERGLPAWVAWMTRDGSHVDTPATMREVNGTTYQLNHACKPHDCGDNQMEVMFAPGGRQAWAVLVVAGKPARFFGAPDQAQGKALSQEVEN